MKNKFFVRAVLLFWLMSWFSLSAEVHAPAVTEYRCQKIFELIRVLDGGHPIWEIEKEITDLDTLLPETRKEFGDNAPTLKNRIRQAILSNKALVKTIRWALTGRKETKDSVDLLKDIPRNVKFNYVIHGEGNGKGSGIAIGRVQVKIPKLDDLLSKHLLLANLHPDVRYAGEFWVDDAGVIHVSNNSGTYTPNGKYITNGNLEKVLRQIFPSAEFNFKTEAVDAFAIKEAQKNQPSKLAKLGDVIQTVAHLDLMFPMQKHYSKVILKTAKAKYTKRVPIRELFNVINMDKVKEKENIERAERIEQAKAEISAAGGLTRELQKKLFTEDEPMSVVRDNDGRYVAFDGNGRLQSLEMVYGKMSNVEVEVEFYEEPDRSAVDFMTWVRKWRELDQKGTGE